MAFGKDMDMWQRPRGQKGGFVEKRQTGWFASKAEVKLLAIAGVGFFMDSYDLFIINMVVPILQVRYFPDQQHITWGLDGGVLKASANIGNVIGQLSFGFLGDAYGRQSVYGKELIIIIVALIFMISPPDYLSGTSITIWITVCRIIMGIGIGGDYPMSACVVAERAHLRRRGAQLSAIFSAQGFGGLAGALCALIVIAGYYHNVYVNGKYLQLTGAWRLLFAFGLIPAFIVLYFRLTMAESLRFIEARRLQDNPDLIFRVQPARSPTPESAVPDAAGDEEDDDDDDEEAQDNHEDEDSGPPSTGIDDDQVRRAAFGFSPIGQRAHNREFFTYFSQWRHLKILIGTSMAWFLVDVAFYGINLNQAFILAAINFTAKQPYRKLLDTAVGNVIIIAAGYFPGYFFTIGLIERMGRRTIQIMGFFCTGVLLLVAGASFHSVHQSTAGFFVLFTLLQFFFNFGANTTTFVIPAEAFPTRIRATAHGFSAAVGKLGAIFTGLAFVSISKRIGTGNTMLILMACSFAGIPFTLLIPETMRRDADVVDREELLEEAKLRGVRDPYASASLQAPRYVVRGKELDHGCGASPSAGGYVDVHVSARDARAVGF